MGRLRAIYGVTWGILPCLDGLLVTQIGSALATVFALATAARTFEQLRSEETTEATA